MLTHEPKKIRTTIESRSIAFARGGADMLPPSMCEAMYLFTEKKTLIIKAQEGAIARIIKV